MTQDFKTKRFVLTMEIENPQAAMNVWEELHGDEKISVRFSKHRRKRSLDSNAYAWVLMDRLSAKLLIPKEQIYRHYITEIGGVSDTVCVRTDSVNKLRETWAKNGIGWLSASFPSSTPGYTNVILYYGSSTYDTRQMHRLIELIVQDCKAQGIETADPAELQSLLESWDRKR
jgi:hypothetical protein